MFMKLFRRERKNRNIFDVPAVLDDFYALAHKLGQMQNVQFKEKDDNGDSILWRFNYKGNKYTLSFSIYNGLSIYTQETLRSKASKKAEEELAGVVNSY
ncbi:MAG: hypothetical protein QM610_04960 [Chitinophagaceae bacterium]